MKNLKNVTLFLITLVLLSCSDDDYNEPEQPQPVTETFVLKGEGTVLGQSRTIIDPFTGETIESICFTMDLVDPANNRLVGTLQECDLGTVELDNGSLVSDIFGTFNIDGRGSISYFTEVLQEPLEDAFFSTIAEPTEDNILETTFEFAGGKGTVFLSGKIDLAQFESGIIGFNCTFTISITK